MISYRIQSPGRNVADLLDPEHQVSYSYCPHIDEPKVGVSGCSSIEELAEYLVQTGIRFTTEHVVVVTDGPESDDEPEDADMGEILTHPERIMSVEPMTDRLADLITAACDAAGI